MKYLMDLYKTARERRASSYSLALVRVLVGSTFVAHGWQKLSDIPGTIVAFARLGFPAPEASVYGVILCELLGGLGLLVGMFTPLAALGPLLSTAATIVFVQREHGFFADRGGAEYSLLLGAICVHFVIRGGGSYSIDAVVGPRRPTFRRRHRQVAVTT